MREWACHRSNQPISSLLELNRSSRHSPAHPRTFTTVSPKSQADNIAARAISLSISPHRNDISSSSCCLLSVISWPIKAFFTSIIEQANSAPRAAARTYTLTSRPVSLLSSTRNLSGAFAPSPHECQALTAIIIRLMLK